MVDLMTIFSSYLKEEGGLAKLDFSKHITHPYYYAIELDKDANQLIIFCNFQIIKLPLIER